MRSCRPLLRAMALESAWCAIPGGHSTLLKRHTFPFRGSPTLDVLLPAMFPPSTEIASEGLRGRVFELSLADLNSDVDQAYRKIKLIAEDVQGFNILTNFHGMDMTRDKLSSLIKKWQTLIEAHVDVKTTDNYVLRMFCVAFTTKMPNQIKKTCYAQSSQIREIRKKVRPNLSCREHAAPCISAY